VESHRQPSPHTEPDEQILYHMIILRIQAVDNPFPIQFDVNSDTRDPKAGTGWDQFCISSVMPLEIRGYRGPPVVTRQLSKDSNNRPFASGGPSRGFKQIDQWCRRNRHLPVAAQHKAMPETTGPLCLLRHHRSWPVAEEVCARGQADLAEMAPSAISGLDRYAMGPVSAPDGALPIPPAQDRALCLCSEAVIPRNRMC
jgi:hypothetical protein